MITSGSARPHPGNTDFVRVAGTKVPFGDALTVIVGYCLGEEDVQWSGPANGIGGEPATLRRGAFAYRTYDCVPGGPTSDLEPIDVFVADGLNARMLARDIAGVLAVADDVSYQLVRIDAARTCFWDLPRDQVVIQPTDEDSPAWPVWRPWTILRGVEGINVARTHKILHHKRPSVFPLLDNETIKLLKGRQSAWAAIHDDLTATAPTWSRLETEVAALLASKGDQPLGRLRLHDILLWTDATGRRATALRLGAPIIRPS